MKKIIVLLIVSAFLFSCNRDGGWSDDIKLSTKTANFAASGDSITITTEGSWWWINDVKYGDTYFSLNDSIHIETDEYYVIVDSDFVVEHRNNTTLFIQIGENNTGVQRTLKVELEEGDYFDNVTVTQAAK